MTKTCDYFVGEVESGLEWLFDAENPSGDSHEFVASCSKLARLTRYLQFDHYLLRLLSCTWGLYSV